MQANRVNDPSYLQLYRRYDAQLDLYGDTAQGAGWPNEVDRQKRFSVMLDILPADLIYPVKLLDFGCGTGELFRYLQQHNSREIEYKGLDVSSLAIQTAKAKFPGGTFYEFDVLRASSEDLSRIVADYCVINGVFTVKYGLSDNQMWEFLVEVVRVLWSVVGKGIAFNVMSKQVDWEREDLFHVSLDKMAEFLHKLAGRAVTFRSDYGLFEYTCYIKK